MKTRTKRCFKVDNCSCHAGSVKQRAHAEDWLFEKVQCNFNNATPSFSGLFWNVGLQYRNIAVSPSLTGYAALWVAASQVR